MKVRITYTFEVNKEYYYKLKEFFTPGKIRDLIFGWFVLGGKYTANDEIDNILQNTCDTRLQYEDDMVVKLNKEGQIK